jgi:uncharacterized protein (DUF58 family)
VNTNNNLVCIVVAMLLGVMGASGFFGKRNLSQLDVSFTFPREIYSHRPFTLTIRLKNRKTILPVFLLKVVVNGKRTLFPFIDPTGEATAYVPFTFDSRGLQPLGAIYVESSFPFSFFVRARRLGVTSEAIVFPKPLECSLFHQQKEDRKSLGGEWTKGLGDTQELAAIRDYSSGDPLRYINWKATAKTGKPKTKVFSSSSQQPVFLDFEKMEIRGIEERLSCVTFLVLDLMEKEVPVGIRFSHRLFEPALSESHKLGIMKELALYDQP